MYVLGPSIQLRPATVSSSVQIASMKEEKELSPREGGNLLSCPQNEMGGERGGEKGKGMDRQKDRSRYPRGMYIKPKKSQNIKITQ